MADDIKKIHEREAKWQKKWQETGVFTPKNDGTKQKYYNLIEKCDEIGIDASRDSYDGGLHLNVYGAEKTTVYFGEILFDLHDISGEGDARDDQTWREKVEKYYKERNK